MGRLCVYVDFTRVFDVCGEKCDGLCTFMWFHRGFCIILVWNLGISMFMWKHRGFRYVFKQFLTEFRLKLWRRCVPQGNLPPFCIAALAQNFPRNVPMPAFMQFYWGFREIFTKCSHKFRMKVMPICVSQGISPPFGVAALAPSPSRIVRLWCFAGVFASFRS